MQHARFYNSQGTNNRSLKGKEPGNGTTSIGSRFNRDKPVKSANTSTRNVSNTSNSTMSSNQASLIVGSVAASGRSRSSSVQMNRTLNPKSSDNTIVVGRHFDQRTVDFDRSNKRSISQTDQLDLHSTSNKNNNQTIGSSNTTGATSHFRDPTIPIQLTIWFHELRTSSEDFMIDLNLLTNFKIGDIIELEPIHNRKDSNGTLKSSKKILFIIKEQNLLHNTPTPVASNNLNSQISTPSTPNLLAQGNFQSPASQIPNIPSTLHYQSDSSSQTQTQSQHTPASSHPPSLNQQGSSHDLQNSLPSGNIHSTLGHSQTQSLQQQQHQHHELQLESHFFPLVDSQAQTATNQKSKNLVQMSLISNPLQRILDLLPRSLVQVRKISNIESIEADTIEISIKNLNLSRDSMWILSSDLINTCVFNGKRISFLNNRVGFIKNIYKNGKKCFSSYVGKNTKIVYRSDGSRLIFLIQTSREMWHFEESGEIMFHKLVNNLFPKIFKKWREKDAQHSITIVLFTSIDLTDMPWTSLGHGERPNKVREYFRVVVDQVNIFHWSRIMENLRLEFANFKRDIMLNRVNDDSKTFSLEGTSLPAVKGNILESINVGLSLLKDKFTDTDLKHSLNHLVVITPGTGLFDVDYKLMLETSKKMSSSDCALDIICLSQPPLHIVPLFRFKDLTKNGKLSHCVPNWCDISFFKDSSGNKDQWIPRCKIYELQMMGLMENDVHDIEIERFNGYRNQQSFIDAMDSYDNDMFKPVKRNKDSGALNFSQMHESKKIKNEKKMNKKGNKDINNGSTGSSKDVQGSLLFINDGADKKTPKLATQVSTSKFNIGITSSAVLGTVTNPNQDASALSTLYQIKGTGDLVPIGTPSIRPRLVTSSNNSIRSLSHLISNSGLRSSSSKQGSSLDKLHPKLIKKEDIFKPKDSSRLSSSNNSCTRSIRENSDRDISDPSAVIKRNSQTAAAAVASNTTVTESKSRDEMDYFWTEIVNPSKELHSDALSFIRLGKWNQVFPPNIRRNLIKWRSFQSPAALPIFQPFFPTLNDLNTNYTTQIYTLLLNPENNLELETSDDLMREMIQLRLLLGFQICDSDLVKKVESEKNQGSNVEGLIKFFKSNYTGAKIYMMLDNEIHRISNDGSTIGVQLYKRIQNAKLNPIFKSLEYNSKDHCPLIRTRYADEYSKSPINFIEQKPQKYNWNQFDQLLAGYDDALPEENKSFFKMKFVVMPADIPKNAFFISNENLTEEEIRVEGLRKLIAVIEKGKYVLSKEEQQRVNKESIAPEISFYTGNLYDFLDEQAEVFDSTGNNKPMSSLMLSEKLNKSIKLVNLAHEIQSPNGVKIVDRTWHFNTHQNCFIGNEFVTWLIGAFEDIDTREEATAYGQSLMDKGLFKHVENRHGFLDGYYFYELESDYIDKTYRPEKSSSWFSRKRPQDKEPTPTPSGNGSKNNSDVESFKSPPMGPQDAATPDLRRITSVGGLNESDNSSMADSAGSKSKAKKKFVLSRAVKYNADPLKKSYRPEIITVHYDRVHNPEHCFHIRLQWLNTSTNFIDETINNWSRLCERHGLKFVETPWKELCTIPMYNPFHSFVDIKLAINPMEDSFFAIPKILNSNKFYYHLFLLKKSGFLLDNRSAVYFLKENIEISYSWGKPTFKFAQFIHKTGSYVVEVRDNGDFFLAPNNMHIARINAPLSTNSDYDYNLNSYTIDSQRVMLGLRKTCTSESELKRIFAEAKDAWGEDYLKDVLPTDI